MRHQQIHNKIRGQQSSFGLTFANPILISMDGENGRRNGNGNGKGPQIEGTLSARLEAPAYRLSTQGSKFSQ